MLFALYIYNVLFPLEYVPIGHGFWSDTLLPKFPCNIPFRPISQLDLYTT
jgi:hypothetical protein